MTPQDREKAARAAVFELGLCVDTFDPDVQPTLEDLFVCCVLAELDPPDELLRLIPTEVLVEFGYEVTNG